MKMFDRSLIFNSDETPIRVSPQSLYTTARIGQDTPHVHAQPGQKEVVSCIATISADGKIWPLTVVAKGKTPTCVRNLDMPEEIYREWTPSGKTNEEICARHVERISEFAGRKPCCLIWDSYGSHWTQKVYDTAFVHKVRLEQIPENATGILQPLDTTVFPVVAARHQARLRAEEVWTSSILEAKKRAIQTYSLAWKKVERKVVHKAFNKMCAG